MTTPPRSEAVAAGRGVPRLVATDLDGTLLRADGTVSERTRAVLRRATAAGTHVVAVTGRPVRWMQHVAEVLQRRGSAVCSNGAVVYDLATDQVVEAFPLPRDTILDLATALRSGFGAIADDAALFGRHWGFHLDEVVAPVRWWHGDADNIVPLPDAVAAAERLPDVELHVRPGESHLGGFAVSDEVLEAMATYLRRLP